MGKRATKEQRAASEYLGSLDDALARWVQSTGPIDAYDAHLPVTLGSPLDWFSYAIISRQLSRASSSAIYHRLVERLGGAITAERVVLAGEQTMRDVGLSHQKAMTIRALAGSDEGLLELDNLAAMTDAEIQAKLVAVPGIGPSSAQRFMLHYLRRPDIFLAGDLAVRAAITALDRLESTITQRAAEQRSEPWRPYRSYATSYLWGYVWGAPSSRPGDALPLKM
jgi:DNA-3-methyladenine glycosylase II